MSTHISDELPRLLTGDAPRDVVLAVAAHLRTCEDCRQELVSATVAHASLSSAQRFAPEAVQPRPAAGGAAVATPESRPAAPLPDLSALFSQVRTEAGQQAEQPPAPRRARLYGLAVAAAAAGLLLGGGAVVAANHLASSHPSGHSVALSAFDTGRAPAQATIGTNGVLSVNATALPAPDAAHRYEVWLTNGARTQMQPVGWVGADGKAKLSVPGDLLARFSAIEVSVQNVGAASYDFSGTSVLRGDYAA